MATKAKAAVKKTTLKDKVILLERERDFLRAENTAYTKMLNKQLDTIDTLKKQIQELLTEIRGLHDKIEQLESTNRPWLLRVLGR